jgi:hypothetical protein
MPRKTFTAGEVLAAADVNEYLMDQSVMTFADSAARGSAIGTATEGMLTYLEDTDAYQSWNGSAWVGVGGGAATNAIINGAFEINQRNFTSTTAANNFTFDRWHSISDGGTVTSSAQTFTAGSAPLAEFEGTNFLRMQTTGQSGISNFAIISQNIENVRTFANQTVVISFYAKAASDTPKIAVEISQRFGSGGTSPVFIYAGQVTLSTSWQRFSVSATLPNLTGKTINANNLLNLSLFTSAGSDFNTRTGSLGIQSNTFDIWGVQVEAGSTATPFRRNANSLQGELAACQRYAQIVGVSGVGMWFNTTTCQITWPLATWMRVAPSATLRTTTPVISDAGVADRTGSGSTISLDTATTSAIKANITGFSSATNGRVAQVKSDGMVLLEAEL